MEARKQLLKDLLALQTEVAIKLITDDELILIQQLWNGAREPDDGRGVARLVNGQKGLPMNDLKNTAWLRGLEQEVAEERQLSSTTLQRLVAKEEEYMRVAEEWDSQANSTHPRRRCQRCR
jgi:hypothetical protein